MFGIDSAELLIIAVVALVVIGPKDLPRVLRTVGNFVAKARGMASHFRMGMDNMIRETELADMERKWKEQNERIMSQYPAAAASEGESDWGAPPPGRDPVFSDADPAVPTDAPTPAPTPAPAPAPPPASRPSGRIPARQGPQPPKGARRAPLPPRPGELP